MCHFQVSSHTLLVCSIFCHRVQADYGPPIAAGQLSPSPHSLAMCATFRSLHTAVGAGRLRASHSCLP
ncbi:unnamed protein product [Staurois parvus]|uniref:Secreted protein n=1 Tax=Staurois parvus TaxID=386267 RepID=A0ABN9G1U2_9NEOB|nr:unnamed protein product [Staurois parvus]